MEESRLQTRVNIIDIPTDHLAVNEVKNCKNQPNQLASFIISRLLIDLMMSPQLYSDFNSEHCVYIHPILYFYIRYRQAFHCKKKTT